MFFKYISKKQKCWSNLNIHYFIYFICTDYILSATLMHVITKIHISFSINFSHVGNVKKHLNMICACKYSTNIKRSALKIIFKHVPHGLKMKLSTLYSSLVRETLCNCSQRASAIERSTFSANESEHVYSETLNLYLELKYLR